MDATLGIFLLAAFVAVVLMIFGGLMLWDELKGPEARKLDRRLRGLSAGGGDQDIESLVKSWNRQEPTFMVKLLLMIPRMSSLDRILLQAGLDITVSRFLLICLAGAIVAGVGLLHLGTPLFFVLSMSAVAAIAPIAFAANRRRNRLNRFDEGLPDALDLISRGLRSGLALPAALQLVATEGNEPVRSEFAITFDEINYGVSMSDAMTNLAKRIPSLDLRCFVISVLLQRETGGNLAEVLNNLSVLIRERFKLFGKIRVLAAEGKLSAYILIALPFVTAFALNTMSPDFMRVLWTDPAGIDLVFGALLMMLLGAAWMWRIVRIRV
jgi:tight adherence protein B